MSNELSKRFNQIYFHKLLRPVQKRQVGWMFMAVKFHDIQLIWLGLTISSGLGYSLAVGNFGFLMDMIYWYLVLNIPIALVVAIIFFYINNQLGKFVKKHGNE